jgi:hypothetical protein
LANAEPATSLTTQAEQANQHNEKQENLNTEVYHRAKINTLDVEQYTGGSFGYPFNVDLGTG